MCFVKIHYFPRVNHHFPWLNHHFPWLNHVQASLFIGPFFRAKTYRSTGGQGEAGTVHEGIGHEEAPQPRPLKGVIFHRNPE